MRAPAERSLAELQARMSAALLAAHPADQQLPAEWFAGAHAGSVGLRVHRNTVLSAISHALQLSYVSIERLVGEEFFDRMAVEYARSSPPGMPQLDEYGRGFADFVAGFPGTESLSYLAELARLDWELAELGRVIPAALGGRSLALEGGMRLRFASPLRVHRARYPVDPIRAAILAEDIDALRTVAAEGRYAYALWRSDAGVHVRALSEASADFLDVVVAGGDGEAALAAAAAAGPDQAAVSEALSRDILSARFVQVEAPGPR
jgi:hypothetical protein